MNELTDKNVTEMKLKENNFMTLEPLGLSDGFVCDVETGICGPADKMEMKKEQKEDK